MAIDLYDIPDLREASATPWDVAAARQRIERDQRWRVETGSLSASARSARLEADARFLVEAPRYSLRAGYRSFDHIHPNREGHMAMARAMCPQLPASWGCQCPR